MESEFLCTLSPSAQQEMRCRHRGADQMMCHARSEDLWLRSSRWNVLSSYVAPAIDQTSCCLQSSAAIHLLNLKQLRLPDAHERARIMWKYLGCEHKFMQNACFWLSTSTQKDENLLAVSNWNKQRAVFAKGNHFILYTTCPNLYPGLDRDSKSRRQQSVILREQLLSVDWDLTRGGSTKRIFGDHGWLTEDICWELLPSAILFEFFSGRYL